MTDWTPKALADAKRRLRRHREKCSIISEAYRRACDAYADAYSRAPLFGKGSRVALLGLVYPSRPEYPPFPEELRALPCGAQTRAGSPCKRLDIYSNGRCKLHGGLSTGPRTSAGRERAIANLLDRWRPDARAPRPGRADRIKALEAKVRDQLEKAGDLIGTPWEDERR